MALKIPHFFTLSEPRGCPNWYKIWKNTSLAIRTLKPGPQNSSFFHPVGKERVPQLIQNLKKTLDLQLEPSNLDLKIPHFFTLSEPRGCPSRYKIWKNTRFEIRTLKHGPQNSTFFYPLGTERVPQSIQILKKTLALQLEPSNLDLKIPHFFTLSEQRGCPSRYKIWKNTRLEIRTLKHGPQNSTFVNPLRTERVPQLIQDLNKQ
jgi:hypothetical protein